MHVGVAGSVLEEAPVPSCFCEIARIADSSTFFLLSGKEEAIRSIAFSAAKRLGLDAIGDFCCTFNDEEVPGCSSLTEVTADPCTLPSIAGTEGGFDSLAFPVVERFGLDAIIGVFCAAFEDARVFDRFCAFGTPAASCTLFSLADKTRAEHSLAFSVAECFGLDAAVGSLGSAFNETRDFCCSATTAVDFCALFSLAASEGAMCRLAFSAAERFGLDATVADFGSTDNDL